MPFQPYITSYNINITRYVGIAYPTPDTENERWPKLESTRGVYCTVLKKLVKF